MDVHNLQSAVATVVGAAAIFLVDDIITVEAEEIMVVEVVGGTFPAVVVVVEEGHYLEWGAPVIRPWEEATVAVEEITII